MKSFDHFDAAGNFLHTFAESDDFLTRVPPAKDAQDRDRTIEAVPAPSYDPATERLTRDRTGWQIVALTAEQQTAYAAAQAETAERTQFEAAVAAHLDDLNTIIGTSGALTLAQLSNAVRVLARGQKGLIKRVVPLMS